MAVRHALIDLRPLRVSPAFHRLWWGRLFSTFGGQMTQVAVLFQIWQATRSPIWTGAVGLAQAVPIVVLGLFAGTLIDRHDRRRIYLIGTVAQALCATLLAVQGFLGGWPPTLVLAVLAVESTVVSVSGPTARTFVPRLLPPDLVPAGMALNRVSFQTAMLVGPALGGLILGRWGVGACYAVDAVTFGLAFLGAFGLPPMRPQGEPARAGVQGVLDGLRFLTGHRIVRAALLTDLATMVLSMPIALFPVINAERFADNPRTLGLFLSAIAVGGVLASVLSGTFTRAVGQLRLMMVSSVTWGLALAGFGAVRNAWVGLALLIVAGAADTVSVVSRGAVVQTHTPDELRGRVASAEQIVGQAGPDLGNMRGGLIAGWTSAPFALVSGGVSAAVAVLAVAVSLRRPALTDAPVAGKIDA